MGAGAQYDPTTNNLILASEGAAELRPVPSNRRKLADTTGDKTVLAVRVSASGKSSSPKSF